MIKKDYKDDYVFTLNSGMFFEFYPSLSGDWESDKVFWNKMRRKEEREKIRTKNKLESDKQKEEVKKHTHISSSFKDFYSKENSLKATTDLLKERMGAPISVTLSEVIFDMFSREQLGIKKYGTTIDRDDYSLKDWMQHHYEELLDAALYVKKQIQKLENK